MKSASAEGPESNKLRNGKVNNNFIEQENRMTIKNMWVAPSTNSDGNTLWFVFAAGHSENHCIDIAKTEADANDMIKHIEAGAKATNPYFDNEEEQRAFRKLLENT